MFIPPACIAPPSVEHHDPGYLRKEDSGMACAGRSVLAYFTRREQAEQARRALRHEGFETVQLDRIGRYGGGSSPVLHNALTGGGDSLADMTAGADTGGGDAGPLLAADPAASGLA